MRHIQRRARLSVVALASMSIIGCMGYNARPIPAPSPTRQLVGESVRVTKKDGVQIELQRAYVEGDSVRGTTLQTGQIVVVPISSIAMLEARGLKGGQTLGLIGTLGAIIALAVMVALLSQSQPWN